MKKLNMILLVSVVAFISSLSHAYHQEFYGHGPVILPKQEKSFFGGLTNNHRAKRNQPQTIQSILGKVSQKNTPVTARDLSIVLGMLKKNPQLVTTVVNKATIPMMIASVLPNVLTKKQVMMVFNILNNEMQNKKELMKFLSMKDNQGNSALFYAIANYNISVYDELVKIFGIAYIQQMLLNNTILTKKQKKMLSVTPLEAFKMRYNIK